MTKENKLPKDWKRLTLGSACKLKNGFAFKSSDYIEDGIPVIRISDIKDGLIVPRNTVRVKENPKFKDYTINSDDILVAMSGATTGKFGIFKTKELAYQNQRVGKFEIIDKQLLDNNFLLHQLHSLKRQIEKDAYGGAQPNISSKKIEEMEIVLPPLATQQAIVSKIEELFSELDASIQNLKTAQAQLKTYRQAVLKWAFEGKLTNKNVKDGELPKGWELMTLNQLTLDKVGLRRGPFGSAIKKEFFVKSGYKIYEQGNAINNDPYRGSYFITKEKYNELINFKVEAHDLIVSCSGVTLGRICEIPEDAKEGVINQALLRIRLRKDLISNKYFILHFRGAIFQKKIFDQSQGTAMPNLVGIKDFKEIAIPIPSLDHQSKVIKEIESRLSVADKMEESINQSLQLAEALRQSILKKAFEGGLV